MPYDETEIEPKKKVVRNAVPATRALRADGGLHGGAPRAGLCGVVRVGARASVRRRASGPCAGLVL